MYDTDRMKLIMCYYSWDNLEPSAKINSGFESNPKKLEFASTLKIPQKGIESYDKPFLFLTIEPKIDFRLKISVQFK